MASDIIGITTAVLMVFGAILLIKAGRPNVQMTKRRPKKTNPFARKPSSRHKKEQCPYCGEWLAVSSMAGHIEINHHEPRRKKDL